MSGRKGGTAKSSGPTKAQLKKIDDYVLGPKDYEEIPELTDEWFRGATLHIGGKPVPRGRPKAAVTKDAISLRLDPDVLAYYRRGGRGWQSRINAALRKAAKLSVKKREKA